MTRQPNPEPLPAESALELNTSDPLPDETRHVLYLYVIIAGIAVLHLHWIMQVIFLSYAAVMLHGARSRRVW